MSTTSNETWFNSTTIAFDIAQLNERENEFLRSMKIVAGEAIEIKYCDGCGAKLIKNKCEYCGNNYEQKYT